MHFLRLVTLSAISSLLFVISARKRRHKPISNRTDMKKSIPEWKTPATVTCIYHVHVPILWRSSHIQRLAEAKAGSLDVHSPFVQLISAPENPRLPKEFDGRNSVCRCIAYTGYDFFVKVVEQLHVLWIFRTAISIVQGPCKMTCSCNGRRSYSLTCERYHDASQSNRQT